MYENLFPTDLIKCGELCWNNPDPLSYSWTPPPSSLWDQLFGGGMITDAVNFAASMLMEFLSSALYIAILFASYLSDPSWIMNPVADQMATLFRAGYDNLFLRFAPILLLLIVIYAVWQYAKGDHVKLIKGLASTILTAGLIVMFFYNFGTTFKWLNAVGNGLATQVGISVVETADVEVKSQYDTLWKAYVLYPFEYGQFGQVSSNLNDFDVSQSVAGSTYTDDAGNEKQLTTSDNWVRLLLQNTSPEARESLAEALFGDKQPALAGQLEKKKPNSINPYQTFVVVLMVFIFILPALVFLVYLGFQLFVREMMFLVTMFLGIVTVPMAFVPEIGVRVTVQWMREGLGHLVERLAITIYGAIVFAFVGLITNAMMSGGSTGGLMLAIIINAIVFTAAILYRNKIFSLAVHPLSDRVRFRDGRKSDDVASDQEDGTSGEKRGRARSQQGEQQSDKRNSSPRLATRFQKTDDSSTRGASVPRGSRSAKPSSDESEGSSGIIGKFKRHLKGLHEPSKPTTREERIQKREAATRSVERKIDGKAISALVPSKLRKGESNEQTPQGGRSRSQTRSARSNGKRVQRGSTGSNNQSSQQVSTTNRKRGAYPQRDRLQKGAGSSTRQMMRREKADPATVRSLPKRILQSPLTPKRPPPNKRVKRQDQHAPKPAPKRRIKLRNQQAPQQTPKRRIKLRNPKK